MKNLNLIEKALQIALKAHEGQKRKTDDSPYIIHPIMCALKLKGYNFSEEAIASALVHDVLEDSDFSENDLKNKLGEKVFNIIKSLSEDKSLAWEERKKQYIENIKNGSLEVKAVSLADKIHNLESLLLAYEAQGKNIWSKFNRGKDKKLWFEKEVLHVLKETWEHPLILEYEKLIKKMEKLED
jgi:(p)ppGpp synthase/HD superfamily hydrolase